MRGGRRAGPAAYVPRGAAFDSAVAVADHRCEVVALPPPPPPSSPFVVVVAVAVVAADDWWVHRQ